jgi:hypothetical protein
MNMRIALLLLMMSAPAVAEDPEALIHRGVELRKKGHDAEALPLFQRAFDLSHSARAEAQVGLAEQALGNWLVGARHLREALSASEPWIEQHRATIEEALQVAQQHLGSVVLAGGVAGGEVLLDGEPVGTLPLREPLWVVPGAHKIVVNKDNYQSYVANPTVVAGHLTTLPVAMTAIQLTVAPATAAPVAHEDKPRSRRALWIGVGVGAAVLVVAVVAIGVGVAVSQPTDFAAGARASCQPPCMVYTVR